MKGLRADSFAKNVALVFAGTTLVNILNMVYQLLIAHQLPAEDFAAFNSLLSIFVLLSTPLAPLGVAIVKYASGFKARGEDEKVRALLSGFLKQTAFCAGISVLVFYFLSPHVVSKLKIASLSSAHILTLVLALAWFTPVALGGLQGLELFGWLVAVTVAMSGLKLFFAFVFVRLGYAVSGALGALLLSYAAGVGMAFVVLRGFLRPQGPRRVSKEIRLREVLLYALPVAAAHFCFMSLVSLDMVLVKYYFAPADAGAYSLAQMVGKIFLFLPGAISMVMFPRTSGLSEKNMDTRSTLKRSMLYAVGLCVLALVAYNLFPAFFLTFLTGKSSPQAISLGRLFSISMSGFACVYIFMTYFLSVKDLRFIKYAALVAFAQVGAIVFFHGSLTGVQLILCASAAVLFAVHLILLKTGKA